MPSAYIAPGEYAAYGLAGSTQVGEVQAASVLIDVYLRRTEGLVWAPDAAGSPCYMAGSAASLSFATAGAVSPGSNVVVPVAGGLISPDLVGDVLIFDAATPNATEACVVTAVGVGTVTLQAVANSHISGVKLEGGRVILEERSLPANRTVTRATRAPMARMLAVQGRYAYGRRSQQQAGVFAEPSILSSVQVFGGPPAWYAVDVAHVSISHASGEVWIPAGALMANFSDVRLRYVAGYAQANLPEAVKSACAGLVRQAQATPELVGNIKKLQAGGTQIERFADNMLDAQTIALIEPLKATLFY